MLSLPIRKQCKVLCSRIPKVEYLHGSKVEQYIMRRNKFNNHKDGTIFFNNDEMAPELKNSYYNS